MRASVWLISERYRFSSQSLAKPFGTATRKRLSSTATRAVSLSQVSKLAGDSETCNSPSAARQTCFASIDNGPPRDESLTRAYATSTRNRRGARKESCPRERHRLGSRPVNRPRSLLLPPVPHGLGGGDNSTAPARPATRIVEYSPGVSASTYAITRLGALVDTQQWYQPVIRQGS